MRRRRRGLGDTEKNHRGLATQDFAWTRDSAKQASLYAKEGACVAATTALVRAAYNYGRGAANHDSIGNPPQVMAKDRRKAKRALDEATEDTHRCETSEKYR